MARILSKDTLPEKSVRRLLHSMGYRFRLHDKQLPGRPDIVLRKHKAIVFVHGCFWHLHRNCIDGKVPKTRTAYWKEKLVGNKARDQHHMQTLRKMGWRVLRLWECEVEGDREKTRTRLKQLLDHSKNGASRPEGKLL